MDLPPADPAALLTTWMSWERGGEMPGKILSDLKRAGMRQMLEDVVLARAELDALTEGGESDAGS